MNFGGWFTPKPSSPGEAALQQATAGGGGGGDKDKKDGSYEGSGFDPTGLERAAKAARVLNSSPHAKSALEVIQEQERTKQMEYALQQTQYETYKAKLKVDGISEKYKEDTQYLKRQTDEQKRLAEHSNEMARRRELEKMRATEQLHKKQLADQLALFTQQEEMRRKTIEKEASLRRETEMKKVEAEVAGRIRQEQENHDLRLEQARVQGAEDRQTVLESIKLAGETMGAGLKEFLSDQQKMAAAASTITLVALGIYSAKVGTGLAGRYVEARLGKPSLVRETSRTSVVAAAKNPFAAVQKLFRGTNAEDALSGELLVPSCGKQERGGAAHSCCTREQCPPPPPPSLSLAARVLLFRPPWHSCAMIFLRSPSLSLSPPRCGAGADAGGPAGARRVVHGQH